MPNKKPGYNGICMDLLQVLEKACREYFVEGDSLSHRLEHAMVSDLRCAHHVGAMTPRIAVLFNASVDYNVSIGTIRSILHSWADSGKVLAVHTPGGCSRWWPVGLAETLRSEAAHVAR